MDIEKLIETAKVCCGDIKSEDCSEQCIDPRDNRGTGEDRFCRQWLIHDLYTALSTLKDENEKLRAELEQVKQELDAAVSWAQKYTESIDRPCVACKHNTGDYVCTAICGNCGPMGTESCKWEFDFSGELKED